jgi:succinate dehydrogenase flavin-adding protein (antitoxin of CptAB toxin-antitoxin module)
MAEDVQDTDDYKVSKTGRKIKAHRIIFNKGTDDGKKGITEMKKTYKAFVEQHTAELTEEQKDEIVAELEEALSGDLSAGEWIRDFVHSDNPKFEGKSKDKRKQMALAAYYAKQRNEGIEMEEELKGNQHKLDKNKNGRLDKHDFKLLRKEDTVAEGFPKDPNAPKLVKDRKTGKWYDPNKEFEKKMNSPEVMAQMKRMAKEEVDESVFDWKNKARQTSDSGKTKTYHDVKKVSTGTVYTKQFDKDGVSKGTGDDAAKKAEGAPKRGRGRPKKDKFAEAVEFLLALSEEKFDDMMEEGFDAFIESYEQLDELSKSTLGSYIKMATNKIPSGLAVNAHQAGAEPTGSKARKGFLAKANKRIDGIAKATDRLTK